MIPQKRGRWMMVGKAEHLSFDILEQEKLKLEKIEKKKKKKRRKKSGSKVCPRNMIDRCPRNMINR